MDWSLKKNKGGIRPGDRHHPQGMPKEIAFLLREWFVQNGYRPCITTRNVQNTIRAEGKCFSFYIYVILMFLSDPILNRKKALTIFTSCQIMGIGCCSRSHSSYREEFLTSSICPTCLEAGDASRLAKPAMRTCICLECDRWMQRDIIDAHNIGAVGEVWIWTLTRPLPLSRNNSSIFQI